MLEILNSLDLIGVDVKQLNMVYDSFVSHLGTYISDKQCTYDNRADFIRSIDNLMNEYNKISNKVSHVNKQKIDFNLSFLSMLKKTITITSVEEKINYIKSIDTQNTQNTQNDVISDDELLIDKMIETEKQNLRILEKKKILLELMLKQKENNDDIDIKLFNEFENDKEKKTKFITLVSNKIMAQDILTETYKTTIQSIESIESVDLKQVESFRSVIPLSPLSPIKLNEKFELVYQTNQISPN